ncbi:hypothetical protein HK101_008249 [Irineochytrium annulatum]|nr:hypothetical protein HK101_008249 [Irineochytrium annulatum]
MSFRAALLLFLALPMVSLAAPRRIHARPIRFAAVDANATTSGPDPCTTLKEVGATDNVLACFNQFPITKAQRVDQIANIKRFFEVYSFLELAKSAVPPEIPSNVDILALLDGIAADDSVTRELAFHTKVSDAIASLYDPHASYAPSCFSQPASYQPWVISSLYNVTTGAQTIAIRDLVTNATTDFNTGCADNQPKCESQRNQLNGFWATDATGAFNASDYIGWTIDTINGVPVLDFIQELGDYAGNSKTPESRFNSVVAGYQIADLGTANASSPTWAVTNGHLYFRAPLQLRTDTTHGAALMVYSLISPNGTARDELVVPWVSVIGADTVSIMQQGKDAYYSAFCVPKPAAAPEGNGTVPEITDKFAGKHSLGLKVSERLTRKKKFYAKSRAGAASPDVRHPVSTYSSGAFYNINGDTGVWIFSSVQPPNDNVDPVAWTGSIIQGLSDLKKQGLKNLIIDVSGNGGGVICAGYALAIYLLQTVDLVFPEYDFRLSETSHAILDGTPDAASIFTASSKTSLTGGNITDSDLEKGGSKGRSARFSQSCLKSEGMDFDLILNATKADGPWQGLAMVSDGRCGSTCATFTRILRHQNTTNVVPSFTYGGSSLQAFQPDSFQGGAISNYAGVLTTVQGIIANHSKGAYPVLDAWEPLKLPADMGLPVWAAYSPLSELPDAPSEFVYDVSDGYIMVEDPLDSFSIYRGVMGQMGW